MRPANECDVPVTAYKGDSSASRHCCARQWRRPTREQYTPACAQPGRRRNSREREPTAHKASYRVLPDVLLRPVAWTTHDVTRERTCFSHGDFKAPPFSTDRTAPSNLRTRFLLFLSFLSFRQIRETSKICGFLG